MYAPYEMPVSLCLRSIFPSNPPGTPESKAFPQPMMYHDHPERKTSSPKLQPPNRREIQVQTHARHPAMHVEEGKNKTPVYASGVPLLFPSNKIRTPSQTNLPAALPSSPSAPSSPSQSPRAAPRQETLPPPPLSELEPEPEQLQSASAADSPPSPSASTLALAPTQTTTGRPTPLSPSSAATPPASRRR